MKTLVKIGCCIYILISFIMTEAEKECYMEQNSIIQRNAILAGEWTTYRCNGNILVQLTENCSMIFTKDRKCIAADAFKPIVCDDVQTYIGMAYSEIIKMYGSYHIDLGSGMFYPSYVTQDGYLLQLLVENGIVRDAFMHDLLISETNKPM